MNVTSIISLLPDNKEQAANFAYQLSLVLDSGELNPFDLLAAKKGFEDALENIKEQLADMALAEAEKYGEKTIDYKGIAITKAPVYTSYDYSGCNDFILSAFEAEKKKAEAELKERQKFLQTMRTPIQVVDDSTGELVTIYPANKLQKDGVKVSFRKEVEI